MSKSSRLKVKSNKSDIIWFVVSIITLCIGLVSMTLCLSNLKLFKIASRSMEPTLHIGNIAIIQKIIESDSLEVGDIICYKDTKNRVIIHRVCSIYKDESNKVIIETKGDNNNAIDEDKVTNDNIIGKFIIQVDLKLITSIIVSIGVFLMLMSWIRISKP